MPPCNCHPPFPRPEPFSPLPRPGHVPDWGKWIRDRLAEKGALLAFPTRASFPGAGEWPNLYLDLETGAVYRWDRADYAVLVDPREGNDVLVYDSVAAFPDEGEQGKLYIAANTGSLYRWGGEGYVALLSGKADKAVPQTEGSFAALTQDGNLADSGKKPSDFATAAQGAKADTAVQSAVVGAKTIAPVEGVLTLPVSSSTSLDDGDVLATARAVKTTDGKVTVIEGKIPPQATAQNQLADKAFVNSSIATETATFRGTFNLVTDLQLPLNATHEQVAMAVKTELGQADYDGNDYVFVQIPQDLEHTDAMKQVDRYKCVETGTDPVVKSWEYEWTLNNSSFTAAQWAAINSSITSAAVAKLDGIAAGAQVNVIEGVKVNGTALTPVDKVVNVVAMAATATGADIAVSGADPTKISAALAGKADETTPVVQPPSLSADLFPIVYRNQFGDTLTIESMADVVFEHPGGAYPYELYKSGFYSRICGFGENGVFAGNGGGTVATFNGRNGEAYIWPTLTLSATGGSVVRSTELAEEMSKKMPANATGADIPVDATVGAQKINAALAGKVSKSGDTMTGMLTAPSLTVGARGTGSVGDGSVAEGLGTVASGAFAHAEGLNTVASDRSSHAEGVTTKATGSQSHAEGFHTSATNPNEHAEGSYNASHTSENESSATLHSIGIGTSDNDRRNAVETMKDGKTFVYGIGGYDGTNPTATGVKDLATAVNAKASRASPATAGNLAELTSSGGVVDSQIPKASVATKPANPTGGNLVKTTATGELLDAGYHFEVRNGIPCIVQYT